MGSFRAGGRCRMKFRFLAVLGCAIGLALAPVSRAKTTFDIDYSLDQANSNFFNPNTPAGQAARAAMSAAAHVYEDRILDDLTAITPGGINTWTTDFTNPGNGQAHWAITDVPIATGSIKVYVAGRSL